MSVSINLTGGGGSFKTTDALVRVLAPSGSSVSVTAGGSTKTLQPLAVDGDSTNSCYYDIVKSGNFTSTARSYAASSGGDSASGSVVVNSAKEYTVALSYWDGTLYDAGDEYTTKTGGFEAFAPYYEYIYSPSGCTKNAANLTVAFTCPADNVFNGAWGTANSVNFSGYTTLHVRATSASASGGDSRFCRFGVQQTAKHTQSSSSATEPFATLGVGDNALDISALSGGFVWFGGMVSTDVGQTGTANIVVTKIWLT